jgi:hypothetical protein
MFVVLELCVTFIVWVVMITQVFVPLFNGKIIFPLFRKERKRLEDELQKAKEETDLADLETKIREEQQKTSRSRIHKVK